MKSGNKILTVIILFYSLSVSAAPYVPSSDAEIITVSYANPNDENRKLINNLNKNYIKNENNIDSALAVASAYITLARENGDPRYYGLAENVLKKWWDSGESDELQIIKATILQFQHNFDAALNILGKTLAKNPRNSQAIILRANILMASGRYVDASKNCSALLTMGSHSLAGACVVSINGLRQNKAKTISQAKKMFELMKTDTSLRNSDRQWIIGVLADALLAHSAYELLEEILGEAINNNYANDYLLGLYADILLQLNRDNEVIELLSKKINSAGLLVRLLRAEKKLNSASYFEHKKLLKTLFKEEYLRGQLPHYYEKALFDLFVENNFKMAQFNAMKNWETQRSISDAVLLFDCANQNNDSAILDELEVWKISNSISVDLHRQSL